MFKQWPLAIVALVIGYCILFLRSKSHRKGKTAETPEPAPAAAPEAPQADPIPLPVFPFEKIHEVPISGSDLRYCHPFGPADTIADIWCKLQTFSSPEPITVRLGTPDAVPLFKSHFSPDGAVHSTGAMFADEFASSILRYGWSRISRQVRALSSFGVPANAPEGKYHIYTGPLLVELKAVQMSNVTFRVRATFDANFRLILGHFSNGTDYLHCLAPSGDTDGGVVVGFPWSLTRLTLHSDDRRLISGVPDFVRTLKTSHDKYVQSDTSVTGDVISDGIVAVWVSEWVPEGSNHKSLQISYAPVPKGPLDDFSIADQEFIEFAKTITERHVSGIAIASHGDDQPAPGGVALAGNR
jgi:hypothetical protein